MEEKNYLSGDELSHICGGTPHWIPILDENGNVIGWLMVDDGN